MSVLVKKARSAALALAMAGVAVMVAPVSPAAASPTNCSIIAHPILPAYGRAAHCTSGTGEFRIVIRCSNGYNGGPDFYYYGEWVRPGDYSMTACLTGAAGGFYRSSYIAKRG
ncbi:hypothetical protein AB0M47_20045 [Hamadaea sp. NPDC051192]|uniref:hypothetical protein n=1 Tax=Hamadaea sp. NPDC051192 TaxID=3154940 RepID=UPI00342369A9